MSRVVRVDEEALEVALRYGKNLSEGIMKMEEMLKKQEKAKRDYTNIEEMVRRTIREAFQTFADCNLAVIIAYKPLAHAKARRTRRSVI